MDVIREPPALAKRNKRRKPSLWDDIIVYHRVDKRGRGEVAKLRHLGAYR